MSVKKHHIVSAQLVRERTTRGISRRSLLFVAVLSVLGTASALAQTATVTILHSFNGSDGAAPARGFIKASDGNFYAPVAGDESGLADTIVKMTPAGAFSVIHTFVDNLSGGEEGIEPYALVQGPDGNLYGICHGGGAGADGNAGTFFRMGLDGSAFTKLYDFNNDGTAPAFPCALVPGSDGNFYGLTRDGGSRDDGTYFRMTPGGQITVLAEFLFSSGVGSAPDAQLLVGRDGNFYGLTNTGGNSASTSDGGIFMATQSGGITPLHVMQEGEASSNKFPLIQGSDGNLYGVSSQGGDNSSGSVYRYNLPDGSFTVLHSFVGKNVDGEFVFTALVEGSDGTFFGATLNGFPASSNSLDPGTGSYFAITPNGAFTTIAKTPGDNNGPKRPLASLIPVGTNTFLGVTNGGGVNDDGTIVKLTVTPAARLLNVSTRMEVLTGESALIGGFIVTGTDPKPVIVRGLGPSLPVDGALADPTLELHDGNGILAQDNNWKDHQQADIEATQIPPSNDLESAILSSLPAANSGYTAVLAGNDNGTGIGLVELYDLAPTSNAKLANISTRGFVDTGDNVMIGGFILGPADSASVKILIRGLGPSLKAAGIGNALADPVLELHDGDGNTLASNNNWKDTQQSEITATGIAPGDDAEAAILQVLAPGAYTAVLRGNNNGTGVGLFEAYNLQ